MSAIVQPGTPQISAVDAQRVENTLSLIAPKWTTWVVQTLAQQNEPMRVRDISARIPFTSQPVLSKRLAQMQTDGLVTRAEDLRGAPYQLTRAGASLSQVHQALAHWSQAHLPLGPTAGAERVEDALRRLQLRHTTAVIQSLDEGPMRFVRITEAVGLDDPYTWQRLIRLQADGLVTRTGPRHGDPYTLTAAGQALGPVYVAVEHWGNPTAATRLTAHPVATATRTHAPRPPGSDGIRTAAALRRSPAAPNGLFSHAPAPQPRVPVTITTRSTPSRGR
ncbi:MULTISPECIES: winged helix-turn-helix transcriptional regulator [unclassified Streptomyces]|uniref:winged helix-turn-helix transcriptional regulator n=1 Tax=unclassified Streptomyces TaxID=2593676 RepID=UPI002E2AA162|nr:winged helix-turn-helix transcriptional regulator [Streptomyces sp. NBC_00223]